MMTTPGTGAVNPAGSYNVPVNVTPASRLGKLAGESWIAAASKSANIGYDTVPKTRRSSASMMSTMCSSSGCNASVCA